ncbi:hypothetical protein RoseRS_2076 [Roseiflexus sp. RS-1]|jgi:hypothetical protein|nr:hypothetical protein RoseRS_2076 [Roseiflexus sp. RS-1]
MDINACPLLYKLDAAFVPTDYTKLSRLLSVKGGSMKTYDLYGFDHDDLEAARVAVEQALGVQLAPHESLHRGDYYRLDTVGEENFELQRNFDPFYEEVVEDEFPEISILLYVNGTERPEELERILTARIPNLRLLRRETL